MLIFNHNKIIIIIILLDVLIYGLAKYRNSLGCKLISYLFNLYDKCLLRTTRLEENEYCFKIGESRLIHSGDGTLIRAEGPC